MAATRYHVDSEVGRLHEAILHRPGLELSRLTPQNVGELLFDDVLWAKRAKEEHDAFAETLRDKGVTVHLYGHLLAETLELEEGRAFVLDRVCTPELLGPTLVAPVRRLLDDLDGTTLADYLVGGILKADLHPMRTRSLKWEMLQADDFVLAPLPNHLFQRDNSCWIYGGVTINPMAKQARQRETLHTRAIYRFHPAFASASFERYLGDDDLVHQPATIEGGDVHVLGHGAVLVGMGERTTPMAVEWLATSLFAAGQATSVVAIELPRSHAFMHLDTVMSMVDRDSFVLYPYFERDLRSWTVTPGEAPSSLQVARNHDLWRTLATILEVDEVTVLTTDEDVRAAQREQWDDGTNFLAVAPGVVVGYDRNVATKHDAAQARHRGRVGLRERARPGAWRATLHDLPHRARRRMTAPVATQGAAGAAALAALAGRSLLAPADLTKVEFLAIVDLAELLRHEKYFGSERPRLAGKELALLFEKPSTRTRSAFEVAAHDQGAHVTCFGPDESQFGHKESPKDTARVLGRIFDGIEFRGFSQAVVEVLAAHAGVPVWNGLTDEWHPTQVLADVMTIRECVARPVDEVAWCYVGDGRNNTANSLLVTGALLGMDVRIVAPLALHPAPAVHLLAVGLAVDSGARVLVTDDLAAVRGCDVVSTDVWVSMGEPVEQWAARIDLLRRYQVDRALLAATGNPAVRFMHCLPAMHDTETELGREVHRQLGLSALEVSDEVFESDVSVVFEQAENRLHTIKALLVATLGT